MRRSKFFLFFLVISLIPSLTFAQKTAERADSTYYHTKGGQLLNIGLGLGTNPAKFSFDILNGGNGTGQPSPAINISYEYGLTPEIGVGALIGYYRVNAQQELSALDLLGSELFDDPTCLAQCLLPFSIGGSCDCESKTVEERISVFTLAGKFSYHFVRLPKLDTYTNLTLGYSFNRRKTIADEALSLVLEQVSPNTKVPSFIYYVSAGVRYFFNPNFAAYGELGYSNVHLLHLGASYKW